MMSSVFSDIGVLQFSIPRDVVKSLLDTDEDRQIKVVMSGVNDPFWFAYDDDASTWISDAPESELVSVAARDPGRYLTNAKPPSIIGSCARSAMCQAVVTLMSVATATPAQTDPSNPHDLFWSDRPA